MKNHVFLGFFLLFLSCAYKSDKTYFYYDGNNNAYVITADSLKYEPMIKSQSSSGYYSGGNPRTVALSTTDRRTIINNLNAAVSKPEIQQDKRKKGTGIITIQDGEHKERVIIRYKTEEQRLIEESLKAALQREDK